HRSRSSTPVPAGAAPPTARGDSGIEKVHGITSGLKKNQLKRLSNLYRRRVPPEAAVTNELARAMAELAAEFGRGVSLLLDRRGRVRTVAVGDAADTPIPRQSGAADTR